VSLLKLLRQHDGAWRAFQFRINSKVMPLTWALTNASKHKIPAFRNPENCSPCPILFFQSASSSSSSFDTGKAKVNDRMRFLGHLEQGMWVSCKCVDHLKGVLGQLYNCKVAAIHLTGNAKMQRWQRHISHVDVLCANGEREDFVPVARVHPPHIWNVDDAVSVRTSSGWSQGKITAARQHEEISQQRFEVQVCESRSWVSFGDLLQTGSIAAERKRPVATASSSAPVHQTLAAGTQVKYQERGVWMRAKVRQDKGGDNIEIVTAHPLYKREVVLTLQRSRVVTIMPIKHAHAKRERRNFQGRNGVIPVEDSD